jgi:hypothetical protein
VLLKFGSMNGSAPKMKCFHREGFLEQGTLKLEPKNSQASLLESYFASINLVSKHQGFLQLQ